MSLDCQAWPGYLHLPGDWLKIHRHMGIWQDGVQWNVHPPRTLFQGQLCQQQSKFELVHPFSIPPFFCTQGPGGLLVPIPATIRLNIAWKNWFVMKV